MLKIKIKYHFLKFIPKTFKRNFPEKWNDLTKQMTTPYPDLLDKLFFAGHKYSNEEIIKATKDERLKLVYAFLGIKYKILYKLDILIIAELLKRTEFTVTSEKKLQNIIIKSFKYKRTNFFAPFANFNNVTFGEFIIADTIFLQYIKTKNIKLLYKLTACLYRPMNTQNPADSSTFSGDIREKFNAKIITTRANYLSSLKHNFLYAILFNYKTIRNSLSYQYTYVFGTHVKDPVAETKFANNSNSWKNVLKNLSPNILAIEKYANTNMHTVLEYLDDKILSEMNNEGNGRAFR